MGLLSDDEAKRIATQLVHDIANAIDVDEAASIYSLFASGDGRDARAIGLEVIPQLTAAIDRFRDGDRTLQTLNLVAAARVYNDQREQRQATAQNRNGRRTMNAEMPQLCPRRHRKWQHC